jgi:phosphate transport system protein
MNDHSSKQYDKEFNDIRTKVLQMGGLVENQIHDAIEVLFSADLEKVTEIKETDRRVNAYEVEIDAACTQIIAKRQPTAIDLRMLLGISKIVTDLERCGDKASKIARKARKILAADKTRIPCATDIREMGAIAVRLLHLSLDAFARQDTAVAADIVREDADINTKFSSITRQLITYMMEDPRTISTALEVLFIAKAIERVGDHAQNIAEQIIYIQRGTDVRYVTQDELEREAKGQ